MANTPEIKQTGGDKHYNSTTENVFNINTFSYYSKQPIKVNKHQQTQTNLTIEQIKRTKPIID